MEMDYNKSHVLKRDANFSGSSMFLNLKQVHNTPVQLAFCAICLCVLLTAATVAQDDVDCINQLGVAEGLYFEGNFEGSISAIKKCLDADAYADTLQSEAYRLLCLSYIAGDQMSLARQTARSLLIADSTFQASIADDPRQFVTLISTTREELYPASATDTGPAEGLSQEEGRSWRTWAIIGGSAAAATIAYFVISDGGGEDLPPEFPDPPTRP